MSGELEEKLTWNTDVVAKNETAGGSHDTGDQYKHGELPWIFFSRARRYNYGPSSHDYFFAYEI